ncbi:MAG: respiratory chain complex I subunit 1 family protein [Thermoplasmatales archaeon]|nr:respiratory chain complex I subunit 1 family protein [Thermoplasmatales archaeon]
MYWMGLVENTIIQLLGVILLSPLIVGIYASLKSKIELKKGPSFFQPYYDVIKLLKKETVVSKNSGFVFVIVPYVVFGIYCLIALVIPVIISAPIYFTATVDFLGGALLFALAAFLKYLAAMDSGSNFTTMSVARSVSFNYLSEATLITVFFSVALITGTNNPYVINNFIITHPSSYLDLDHVFAIVAFFMLFIFESGRIPVESSGLMELGMIDDGLNYEYSGKLLAILKWGSYMKQFLLGSVFLNVFLIPWGLFTSFPGSIIDLGIMFGKWLILILVLLVIETSLAKLRLFKVQDYLAVAFTFSLLFLIFSVMMK